MPESLQFETPENVQIEHHPAGLGTRFVAWFVDGIIVNLLILLLFVGLVIFAAVTNGVIHDMFDRLEQTVSDEKQLENPERVGMYFIGIATLVWGLTSFFYFGLSELFWRGQTLGKRLAKVRVVKANGFSLDPISIFVRNIFRVADQLPVLWVVPFLSNRNQRFGDMVAGTIIVSDAAEVLPEIREELSARPGVEAKFRFDNAKLSRLSRDEFDTVEKILDRWSSVPGKQQRELVERIIGPLCKKMQTDMPPLEQQVEFLEDLLAAEYRRQDRQLR